MCQTLADWLPVECRRICLSCRSLSPQSHLVGNAAVLANIDSSCSSPRLWCETKYLCRHTDTIVPQDVSQKCPQTSTGKLSWLIYCRAFLVRPSSRVRRDSRLGLETPRNRSKSLVSVSSRSRKIIFENSRSRSQSWKCEKAWSRSRLGLKNANKPGLGLVSVSKMQTSLVLVSSRSRKTVTEKSRDFWGFFKAFYAQKLGQKISMGWKPFLLFLLICFCFLL